MRTIHLSLAASLVLFVVAFSFIAMSGGGNGTWGWIALGAATTIAAWRMWSVDHRMRVAPPDERTAAKRWTTLYFIQVGMAMTPGIAGFAVSFVGAGRGAYLTGVAISEVLMWVNAPSRRNLARLTNEYRRQGRDIDMTRALLRYPLGRPDASE